MCQGVVESGGFKDLGIYRRGNSLEQGFTENSPYGEKTDAIGDRLQGLHGPCKGMTYTKFKRPKTVANHTSTDAFEEQTTPTPILPAEAVAPSSDSWEEFGPDEGAVC